MIITCEACNTSFNLDDTMLKPTGSKVRCSVCANVFKAFPPPAPAPAEDVIAAESAPRPVSGADAALAAAAARATAEPVADDRVEAPEWETMEHAAGGLPDDETDLDFALSDEPDAGETDAELEDDLRSVLDDDLADIAFEAESKPDAGTADTVMDEADATIIASLDDDDLDLALSAEPTVDDASATVLADLDSDELDLTIDEKTDMGETVLIDLDQEDLQLDVPPGPGDDSESATGVVTDLDDEGLDLEDDFSLEPEAETTPGQSTGAATEESLDDLSLDFDLEMDAVAAEAGPVTEAAADDGLDLVLDLDDEGSGELEPVAETPELEDDLDLSSLEGMLDDEAGDEDVTIVVDEHEAPEPDLILDDAEPKGDQKETLADLEFELDEDGKASFLDEDAGEHFDQEVDLSEIEKMLEEPQAGGDKFASVPEQDLDLDIEASLETEKWMSDSGKDDLLVSDEELDLSELEQVLEDVDADARDDGSEDQELELDLSEEKASVAAAETVAIDSELDFDLSDFEDDSSSKSDAGTVSREPAEMELEFEMEEDSQKKHAAADEGLEETVAIPEAQAAAPVKEKPVAPPAESKPVPRPKPASKGMSKSLVFLLVIAILGGAGYGTYYLLKQSGIEIPYLSDYLKPKVQDPGNLKLTTFEINSKFVDNANVGKLFVITGKVKNGYSDNRGMITLVGKIFSSGKVPIHEETVYCGNVMSDLELANLEWDKIKARLANRLGDNRSNVKIEPGKSIPFMVVFSGLPEDLEEFTIEVVGSTSLK